MTGIASPPIRATGASEARKGISSLNSGAAAACLASGGATFSGEVTSKARARFERNTEIVRLCAKGFSQARVARKFGLCQSSVGLIIAAERQGDLRKERLDRIEARESRRDNFLELYEAGYSLNEIAVAEQISATRIYRILQTHPGYAPRCGHRRFGLNVDVPAWVPEQHVDRYRRLAATNGEEVAAGCIRRLKVLEARA